MNGRRPESGVRRLASVLCRRNKSGLVHSGSRPTGISRREAWAWGAPSKNWGKNLWPSETEYNAATRVWS